VVAWRKLRERVDLGAWTASRPARLVIDRPRIGLAERFLEPELCAWFVDRARPLQKPARVYNPATGAPMQHDTRTNSAAAFTILELDLPMLLVRARIANTLGVPMLFLERFNIFRYETGQRFSRHVDFLDPSTPQFAEDLARHGQRAATFLVYLNDGFEGGETNFLAIGRALKGRLGDAVFFYNLDAQGAPDRLTVHEGVAPTSGEKWLLSQFIRDRPLLPG
jgi:prolyl 4-hydroxylase